MARGRKRGSRDMCAIYSSNILLSDVVLDESIFTVKVHFTVEVDLTLGMTTPVIYI